ncbi:MAG: threonine ammonia-lyase [Corynebacteriales bacterium]|nr:threonine ammonia-lyase [Mycobacteriales bacterium]
MTDLVTRADVEAARKMLAGIIRDTPLLECAPLAAKVGGPAFVKCENLQRTGSFKVRGAYNRIARLTEDERAAGIVTASAGNYAQGVALASQLLGAKSTVFMPVGAPLPKVAATRAYGAQVEFVGITVDESLVAAKQFSHETGATFIHPFDHPDLIAGQGTVGLEILEQYPQVRTIVMGVGGGGLIAGVSAAVRETHPDIKVVGVQAAGAAAYPLSLKAGEPTRLSSISTIADGIAVGRPGELAFEHVKQHVDDIVTVTDDEISQALAFALERAKLVVEPAGVASLAALLVDPRAFEPPVVSVLSGGNIDPMLMLRVIEHGLAAAGRFLNFTVRLPDRPGSLLRLLGFIADAHANVVTVEQARQSSALHLGEADVSVSVETKGTAHSEELLGALRRAKYQVFHHGG